MKNSARGGGGAGDRARHASAGASFLPEKHTDFIFTTLAGGIRVRRRHQPSLAYGLIIFFLHRLGDGQPRPGFGALLTMGIAAALLLLFFAVNIRW